MSNEAQVFNLLSGVEFDDSRLYDLLNLLMKDVYGTINELHPPSTQSFGATGQIVSTAAVADFAALVQSNNLRLTWTSIGGIATYEIRYHSGTDTTWSTATTLLKTTTLSADLDPRNIPLVVGNHTFLIKATNNAGVESVTASTITIAISAAHIQNVSAQVIDNFVLLSWGVGIMLAIDHYNVYKNGSFIGDMKGTFEAIFETISGTYTYAVEAVDIVGNVSSQGSIVAQVKQPPDFSLQAIQTSTFTGTKTNCIVDSGHLLACVVTGRTWAQHFTDNSWTTIQGQLSAGYPFYAEPSGTTGSYEEVFDFGLILSNNIVSVRWNDLTIDPSVTIVCKIAVSDDNITYDSFITGQSRFASSLRYAKVRLEFTGSDTTSLVEVSNLQVILDVKREVDSGDITANASDVGGTEVFFNKAFKDVDSITVTALDTEPVTAIYSFVDIPNPVHFFVETLDATGNRRTALVSWKARGVV